MRARNTPYYEWLQQWMSQKSTPSNGTVNCIKNDGLTFSLAHYIMEIVEFQLTRVE